MDRFGLFRLGSYYFAVPLLRLRKIEYEIAGFRLPRLPSVVAEILISDQQLIPLLILETDIAFARVAEYKVFVESEAGLLALPANETCGIIANNKGTFLPDVESGEIVVSGIFKYQAKEYNVLDLDQLAFKMTYERDE